MRGRLRGWPNARHGRERTGRRPGHRRLARRSDSTGPAGTPRAPPPSVGRRLPGRTAAPRAALRRSYGSSTTTLTPTRPRPGRNPSSSACGAYSMGSPPRSTGSQLGTELSARSKALAEDEVFGRPRLKSCIQLHLSCVWLREPVRPKAATNPITSLNEPATTRDPASASASSSHYRCGRGAAEGRTKRNGRKE